jgi:toxin YoeB
MKNKKVRNKEQAKLALVAFTEVGWEDYQHWQKEDPKQLAKINDLIDACIADPFNGIGKPEPLKGNLTGYWSRRIDRQHRLVYAVLEDVIYVLQCRYHY